MRLTVHRLASLALVTTSTACVQDRGEGHGAGYVVGAAASVADTVRIAWQYPGTDVSPVRAVFRGEVPVEAGAFDVEALLESVGDFEPPERTCLDAVIRPEDPAAPSRDTAAFAVGGIVATEGPLPADDLDGAQMSEEILAAALEVAVVWSPVDVPRDSATGQRLESSLVSGLQLAGLRQCRVPVGCQGVEDLEGMTTGEHDPDLCLDPWPDRGLILVQPVAFGR